MMDCILNSPPFWGALSVFLVGCVVGTSWPKIRRLSPSVRFVEHLDLVRKISHSLESSRGAVYKLPPESGRLRNDMRELKRRMERIGVEVPAPRIGELTDDFWRAYIERLEDCMNARDLTRARGLLGRMRP